ncbi:hypothetical protein GO755_00165 [Spirosoma sp. HMF4905]|uniref:Uncharacterized protein n=1 Tax=Spirosoma arboris TaxID=2682092 RepID=A0A7K1S3Y3_9BACT|nr:hypothetical protein [Spirosoma arboris]MVM28425.1 hypothetical protein [Spirosoma arboris]
MAKLSRTFRISDDANKQLLALSSSFKESGGEIVERAIQLLYDNREVELKKDNDARIGSLKSA